jgi:SlyX protein
VSCPVPSVGPSLFVAARVSDGGRRGKAQSGKEGDRMDNPVLEERVAHLIRAVDDLSDVVARQAKEIDRLTRLVQMLAEREAEREAMAGEGPAANVRPPHW